jgi:hypothetical protein
MCTFKRPTRWVKEVMALLALLIVVVMCSTTAHAGEVDILVQKLVDKGILTAAEGAKILTETKQEVRSQIAQGKHDSLPEWLQNTRVKGDFRLRQQYEKFDNKEERWRTRLRYRLGIESKVNQQVKVGLGIASGGSDPRSTNQTFQDSFSRKGINLDYAFAQYDPCAWATFVGGKMRNPLWLVSDLIWDTDITPEGFAILFNRKVNDQLALFCSGSFFILDEFSDKNNDPYMYIVQPGFDWTINEKAGLKASAAYYGFTHMENAKLDYSAKTNTGAATTGLVYDYDAVVLSAQFRLLPGIVPYAAVFGDYVNNPDPDNDNQGFLLGLTCGEEKVKEFGQWRFQYAYRRLEKDATLDIFPDSDFHEGKTGVKGHEWIVEYGVGKNTYMSLDYYRTRLIHGSEDDANLFQLDWNLKF